MILDSDDEDMSVDGDPRAQNWANELSTVGLDISITESICDDWFPEHGIPDATARHKELLNFFGISLNQLTQNAHYLHQYGY